MFWVGELEYLMEETGQPFTLPRFHSKTHSRMRACIWCRFDEPRVTFMNKAHIVPQALGGKRICANVCDACNAHFGNRDSQIPAIEETIKETLGITRAMFMHSHGGVGKNKDLSHYRSRYFKLDFTRRAITTKAIYRLQKSFQERLAFQFRRGIYKMVLETIEADTGTALESKYDFIREFARYGLGDCPVFYFPRRVGVVLIRQGWIKNPELMLANLPMKYLLDTGSFLEFELLGHVFGIASAKRADLGFSQYIAETKAAKQSLFRGVVLIRSFNDVDLSLNMLKEDEDYARWIQTQYENRLIPF